MHLATVAIPTNSGNVEPVAFALMDTSDTHSWECFVEDLNRAYAVEGGETLRPWRLTIADGELAIERGVLDHHLDEMHQLWACARHYMQLTRANFLTLYPQWKPIHADTMELLKTDRPWRAEELLDRIRKNLDALPNDELKEREEKFVDHVEAHRLLYNVRDFNNTWTTQSAAECVFSVVRKLGIGEHTTIAQVFQALVDYAFSLSSRKDPADEPATGGPPEVDETRRRLTAHAFSHFMKEYNQVGNYMVGSASRDRTTFSISHTLHPDVCRTVDVHADDECCAGALTDGNVRYTCSCNMRVYKGIVCRHILRVALLSHEGKYKHSDSFFNSRWFVEQPTVRLAFSSPLLGGEAASPTTAEDQTVVPVARAAGDATCNAAASSSKPPLTASVFVDGDFDREGARTPAEVQGDLQAYVRRSVNQLGHNVPQMNQLRGQLQSFMEDNVRAGDDVSERLGFDGGNTRLGAERSKRITSAGEVRRAACRGGMRAEPRCGICREKGHDRRTCPVLPACTRQGVGNGRVAVPRTSGLPSHAAIPSRPPSSTGEKEAYDMI
eukprot:GHVU01020979.1.p1 GENE.GHVU01020979.1~~GHVU01020979.1.p1  ORF type:complete len:554 (-),score=63.77 GHVU01020979.1:703-2364(-)